MRSLFTIRHSSLESRVVSPHNYGTMNKTIQVKICGLTNLEDATVAADGGADYLGFILYPPSKRAVTAETVQEITAVLRQRPNCPKLVGVFVNEEIDVMLKVLADCQLDFAQLHGSEVPSLINDPNSPLHGRSFRALRPQSMMEAEAEAEWYIAEAPNQMPTLLMDAYHPELPGGTGDLSDWAIGKHIVTMTNGLLLAGGLTPDNVAQAIREVQPYGVDVASGVEASPGKKDHTAVRAFIIHAKEATAT